MFLLIFTICNLCKSNILYNFSFFCSLTERKKQWELERERQLKLMEEANIPPGHILLPDDERIETLELLKKSKIHVHNLP